MKPLLRLLLFIVALVVLVYFTFFHSYGPTPAKPLDVHAALAGSWRGSLASPGGGLPFGLDIAKSKDGSWRAGVRNGTEYLPFSRVAVTGASVSLEFDHYDSIISAELLADGETLMGQWSRRAMGGTRTKMDFYAKKDVSFRFPIPPHKKETGTTPPLLSGEWEVVFTDKGGQSEAKGIFKQSDRTVEGTFLTPVGDYRFLEGNYDNGLLRLSVFDGAHAFLFRANMDKSGRLSGDFWSRDSYHATWTALKGSKNMPDPFTLTKLTNREKRFRFNFPDMDGKMVADSAEQFRGKVVVVYIFGTWCPNCNDEASFLEELYRAYHDRGLEVIGLANEFSGNFRTDKEMVLRYKKKYGLSWPVLLVGIANKKKTAQALADLDRILAYPTTVFIDRHGKVQKIYTGFNGPGTGKRYHVLRKQFTDIVEGLLSP